MGTRYQLKCLARLFFLALLFGHTCPLSAQRIGYRYDPPGNVISADLGVAAAPGILAQPATQLLQSSGVVTFSVVARGTGLSYQWFSNGVAIAGATSDSLLLTSLTEGSGTGLKGDYYNNMDFTDLILTRTDPAVNFDWGTGSPDPAIGTDTFSVRWTGQVQPLYSETYTFYTISDDGVRLWVNGTQIINNWTDHAQTENSGTMTLTGGTKYYIQMDYYENGLGAVAKLSWSSPSQPKEVIPQSRLGRTDFASYTVRVSNSNGAVTSAPPVTIWLDSNANGLPDWWELQQFGNLNQRPAVDSDGDGVSNLQEFQEGTSPANRNSFNPRLSIHSPHGTVVVSPNQPYYAPGEFVSLTAIPDPGWIFLDWQGDSAGTKTNVSVFMDTNKFVTARFGLPLPFALDHSAQWTSGGDAQWFGQADTSHDNVGAAQSGPIYGGIDGNFNGQQTWIQVVTNTSRPIDLSFWWAVSSQAPDALVLSINSSNVASIAGETLNWQLFTMSLPPDNYTFRWTYIKGPNDLPTGIPFRDSAWLDQVSIVSEAGVIPALAITLTSTNTVILSWPAPSTGFVLQQTDELTAANWINSDAPITVVGDQNQAVISLTNTAQFFRLTAQ